MTESIKRRDLPVIFPIIDQMMADGMFRPYMPAKTEPTEESHKFRLAKREAKMRRRAERYAKASQSQAEGTDG